MGWALGVPRAWWALFILGSLFYPAFYIVLRHALQKVRIFRLSKTDAFFIAEKCTNTLQAVISTGMGLFIANSCKGNIMSDTHWITNMYTCFGLPYFLYDIWAMFNSHYYLNEEKMAGASLSRKIIHFSKHKMSVLVHHLVLPAIYAPIILFFRNNRADYFVGVIYSCEVAIPFISIRYILAQLKLKDSPAYIIFGLLMIVMFFITRILLFPFLYWKYGEHAGIPLLDVPFNIPLHCNVGCLVVLVMQMYFFYLMVRGAVRVFYKMFTKYKMK